MWKKHAESGSESSLVEKGGSGQCFEDCRRKDGYCSEEARQYLEQAVEALGMVRDEMLNQTHTFYPGLTITTDHLNSLADLFEKESSDDDRVMFYSFNFVCSCNIWSGFCASACK